MGPRYKEDFRSGEDSSGCRFSHLLHHLIQGQLYQPKDRIGPQMDAAEYQHLRCEREPSSILECVTEFGQRQQISPCRRATDTNTFRYVTQCQLAACCFERRNDLQAFFKGFDEISIANHSDAALVGVSKGRALARFSGRPSTQDGSSELGGTLLIWASHLSLLIGAVPLPRKLEAQALFITPYFFNLSRACSTVWC